MNEHLPAPLRNLLAGPKTAAAVLVLAVIGCATFAAVSMTGSDESEIAANAQDEAKGSSMAVKSSLSEGDDSAAASGALTKADTNKMPYFDLALRADQMVTHAELETHDNPGVILIVTDTLRPDNMGLYGYDNETSPFMDKLGSNGVTFLNHVSNSTWTKTSMASMLTGLFPARHKVLEVNAKLGSSYVSLAESFKAQGFKTGAVIGNNIAGSRYGLTQGFDFVAEPKTDFGDKPPHAGQVLAKAARWLQKLEKNEPYFLMVLLFDAHDPYYPPSPLRQRFCSDCGNDVITTPEREYRDNHPTDKQIEDMVALYDGEIRFLDDQLANFYGLVGKMNLLDRTNFAIVADHGEAFGEHGVFEHAFHMWDEVVRTPMIVSGPAVKNRGYVATPTSHVDVFPTMLRLAGLEPPSGLQGTSLARNSQDSPLDPARVLVTEVEMYGIHRVAVRDRTRKLVYHSPLKEEVFTKFYEDPTHYPSVSVGEPKWELYNLLSDAHEDKNIYVSDQGVQATRLKAALDIYQKTGGLEDMIAMEGDPSRELLGDLCVLGYVDCEK